jgi:hypothetical protein
MGALKPWHLVVLSGCCLLVTIMVAVTAVAVRNARARRR